MKAAVPDLPTRSKACHALPTNEPGDAQGDGGAEPGDAEGGNRTRTPRGEPDFESGASTSSATSAGRPSLARPEARPPALKS